MRVQYVDGQVGCVMRSWVIDDFGDSAFLTVMQWPAHFSEHCVRIYWVTESLLAHLYRPMDCDID